MSGLGYPPGAAGRRRSGSRHPRATATEIEADLKVTGVVLPLRAAARPRFSIGTNRVALPDQDLHMIPDVVVRHLAEAGVEDADIAVVKVGGPLLGDGSHRITNGARR